MQDTKAEAGGQILLSHIFLPSDWQHSPFINVLRAAGIEQWTNIERSGKVAYVMVSPRY